MTTLRWFSFVLALAVLAAGMPGRAQEPAPAPPADPPAVPEAEAEPAEAAEAAEAAVPAADYDAIQATIDRMRARLEGMGQAAAERDRALNFLEEQIDRAAGRIAGGDETQEALRQRTVTLNEELETLADEREQLTETVDQRAALIANLEQQVSRLTEMLAGERVLVGQLEGDLGARDATLAEVTEQREALEAELEAVRAARQALDEELAALRQAQAAALAQRETKIAELEATVGQNETALGVKDTRISALSRQLTELNRQLGAVESLLDSSETRIVEQQGTIASLGARLEQALLDRVEELSQYRSEFFGRLREVLGDRPEVRIVGDRFVFQSELLFASGSAWLGRDGTEQLEALAQTLREVAATIPPEIDWILRVDGHTDRVPVGANSAFRSNWELSTARAISVVEFLVRQGIPPDRLAATGFGEFQPLDRRDDEIAYRRNRRIEFKLTEG